VRCWPIAGSAVVMRLWARRMAFPAAVRARSTLSGKVRGDTARAGRGGEFVDGPVALCGGRRCPVVEQDRTCGDRFEVDPRGRVGPGGDRETQRASWTRAWSVSHASGWPEPPGVLPTAVVGRRSGSPRRHRRCRGRHATRPRPRRTAPPAGGTS